MVTTKGDMWDEIAGKLIKGGGTAVLLGRTDSGKSTLARYLIEELNRAGVKSALVDADVGQSTIGLPGTISMRVYDEGTSSLISQGAALPMSQGAEPPISQGAEFPISQGAELPMSQGAEFPISQGAEPPKLFFIGDVSPVDRAQAVIRGTLMLRKAAASAGTKAIVVDTTGFVDGEAGRALKTEKIKMLRADYVIAIQQEDELEHILSEVRRTRVIRLDVSEHVRPRTAEERAEYRQGRFNEYFSGAPERELSLDRVGVYLGDFRILNPADAGLAAGVIVGINRGEDTAALGVTVSIDGDLLTLRTPIETFDRVDRVLVGRIKLEP